LEAVGEIALLEVLVQLRKAKMRMPPVLTCWKATRSARNGLGAEIRRSPQAVAYRKRGVGELGKPRWLPDEVKR
jgi:hypothetical protein